MLKTTSLSVLQLSVFGSGCFFKCSGLKGLSLSNGPSLRLIRSVTTSRLVPVAHTAEPLRVQILIKAFEQRYLRQASVVIRDLLLLNFSPKSRSVLPDAPAPAAPLNLVVALGQVGIPQKISRYTVLRSPHVDKKPRETFEMRVHKTAITAYTTSPPELAWFLDALRSYMFTGVQIQVNISSKTYLTPPQQLQANTTSGNNLLAEHMSRHKSLYSVVPSPPPEAASLEQRLRAHLAALHRNVHASVFQEHNSRASHLPIAGPTDTAAPSASPASPTTHTSALRSLLHSLHMQSQPAGAGADPGIDATGPGSSGAGGKQMQAVLAAGGDDARLAALLAAIDAAFLSLDLDKVQAVQQLPFQFASFRLGQGSAAAAEWLHATMKYGQYVQRLSQLAGTEQRLARDYGRYTQLAASLMHQLTKLHMQRTMGDLVVEKERLAELEKEKEKARLAAEAAAGEGTRRSRAKRTDSEGEEERMSRSSQEAGSTALSPASPAE